MTPDTPTVAAASASCDRWREASLGRQGLNVLHACGLLGHGVDIAADPTGDTDPITILPHHVLASAMELDRIDAALRAGCDRKMLGEAKACAAPSGEACKLNQRAIEV